MIGPKVIGLMMMVVASMASAEMKIVVLDPARAILGSDQAKVLVEAARKEMQPDQDELNELAEELQAKQKKLQTDLEILSDNEKRKIAKEIENMQADAQFASQKLQKYAQDKNQEILQSLAPAYEKVLNEIIEIDQIDLILSPTALTYANKKHDITKKVTERLNADKD